VLVSSREIHKGRVVHLFEDTVRLPNGHVATLDMIRHPGAAAVVPFVSLDPPTILLVRQFRHAAGGFLLEAPAGKLDPGEAPEACAARETEEESGYRAGRLEKLGAILTTPGFTDEVIHLYAGFDLVPVPSRLEVDEVLTVERVPFADAIAMVERGEIQDAKTMSALLLAARRWPPGARAESP
jgi:ADP-ribose pyrophosphatase